MNNFIKFITLICINMIILSTFNCSKSTNEPSGTGTFETTLKLKDNSTLLYTIYVPEKYTGGGTKLPLIIALHYGWSGLMTPYFAADYLNGMIKPAFDSLGAIMVAPDCPAQSWSENISENAILELLEFIKKQYNVDSNKVVLTGYSLGGIGTWYMTIRHPASFRAGVIVSGNSEEEWIQGLRNVPLYIIHSVNDEVFLFLDVQKIVTLARKQDSLITFIPVAGITHYETSKFVNPMKESLPWLKKYLNF
jgi:predicted peptidase